MKRRNFFKMITGFAAGVFAIFVPKAKGKVINSNYNDVIEVSKHLGLTIAVPTETTIIGIDFSDRETFNQWITKTPFLQINLPCGCEAIYQNRCDIPHENVQCEHGNYYIRIGKP